MVSSLICLEKQLLFQLSTINLVSPFRFMTRPAFADLAMSEHFSQANNIIASIWSMISIPNVGITGIQGEDLLELAKLSVVKEHRTKMALRSVRTIEDIAHAVNRNGTAQFTVQPRSLEWFEEHGE